MIGREYDDDGNLIWDPDDPLAPVEEAVKQCAGADLIPGKVAAAVEAMARFGMDHPTRITVRAYLKNEGLLGFREFDKLLCPRCQARQDTSQKCQREGRRRSAGCLPVTIPYRMTSR